MTAPASAVGEPAAAAEVFGSRLPQARRYADRLAGDGVLRGLLGPREADRLWGRHLVNCALVTDLLPADVRVVDVGSGAGLPGIPMAIRRPDVRVDLVEPMQRRTDFLNDVVAELGLARQVRVIRGRADEGAVLAAAGGADWVVARAVAPLDRLVRWCLPLLRSGGTLLAVKGESAAGELAEHRAELARLGVTRAELRELRVAGAATPTRVVVVQRATGQIRFRPGRRS